MNMDKKEIRKQIKIKRLAIEQETKLIDAKTVFSRLESIEAFIKAQHILFYHSLPDELPTIEFLDKWSDIKQIYLPRVNGDNLDILAYNKDKLESGAFDIEEPSGDEIVESSIIDIIIVPAVAFDANCNRLGRGKGFYDRLLKNSTALKIGVGYDFQLIVEIPVEPHDVAMDIVITPNNLIVNK